MKEREHVTDGGECWCGAVKEHYGMEQEDVSKPAEILSMWAIGREPTAEELAASNRAFAGLFKARRG